MSPSDDDAVLGEAAWKWEELVPLSLVPGVVASTAPALLLLLLPLSSHDDIAPRAGRSDAADTSLHTAGRMEVVVRLRAERESREAVITGVNISVS